MAAKGGAAKRRPRDDATRKREGHVMASLIAGGVDCDVHPAVPHLTSLLPYLNDYWRDQVTTRGMVDLVSQSYPQNSPIVARPDWRLRPASRARAWRTCSAMCSIPSSSATPS